jgi:hypothetical protein
MGWHLPATASRIGGRANGLQKHVRGCHSDGEAQSAVAIVGEKPVVPRTERQCGSHLQRLVAGGGDLEEDLLLPLQKDFAVIQPAGKVHEPVDLNQLSRAQAVAGIRRGRRMSAGNRNSHLFTPEFEFFLSEGVSIQNQS